MSTLEARFWAKVEKSEQCWVWTASVDSCGYGRIRDGSRARKANRVAWELIYGPIPVGMGVLHRCDNPPCVRPDHLFLGTQRTNGLDAVSKGRSAGAKLRPEQVRAVRLFVASGATYSATGRAFGISRNAVAMLVSGVTWIDV